MLDFCERVVKAIHLRDDRAIACLSEDVHHLPGTALRSVTLAG